jgi:tRNA dimethylallyltransferase
LQAEDPQRAGSLNAADSTRIARALEVVRSTGRPLSHWQARREGGIGRAIELFPLILLPEREALYRRCELRFERMVEHGAVAEVEALLARELDPALPVMRAIGVPEIAGWLRAGFGREHAIAAGQQATRNYAKRQYTWFRRQPPPWWTRVQDEDFDIDVEFATLFRASGLT